MKKTDTPRDPDGSMKELSSRKGMSGWLVALLVAIALGVGFIGGTRSDEILARIPFLQTQSSSTLNLRPVEQAYRALKSNYDGELDTRKLVEGATKGMIDAAGDPYTTYFSKKEASQYMSDLEGTFSGIGAELGMKNDNLMIVTTLDDSPAKKAGLQANDIIAKVNDVETTGWSVDKAVSTIRGEKGTTVKLAILRDQELKEFTITRDTITDPSVKSEVTKDKIGIMRISRFGETDTTMLARKAAQDFKDQGVKGVVVDLRGNGGGYLEAAQDLASLWLSPDQVVVSERAGGRITDELYATGDPLLRGVPTVVLIDGGSASASEILAGALKDNKAATLVGEKSYGKGSVQKLVDLPYGGKLKVTIAKWYTPAGKNINKEGITPDQKVTFNKDDVKKGRDPQKEAALKALE